MKKAKIKRENNKASVMERRSEKEKDATCYMGEFDYEAYTRATSKTCPLH